MMISLKQIYYSLVILSLSTLAHSGLPEHSTTGPIPPSIVTEIKNAHAGMMGAPTGTININVPAYLWRHGCGPTAVGMIVGYYDGLGYSDLMLGSASSQTYDVNQAIASGGDSQNPEPSGSEKYYEDYCRPEDDPIDGVGSDTGPLTDDYITSFRSPHTHNCIADYMRTSRSNHPYGHLYYGWSYSDDLGPSFQSYVNQQNVKYRPQFQVYEMGKDLIWDVLIEEIDNNRPMIFLVDSNADGKTDHFVPVIGYNSATQQYGCLDSWDTSIHWWDFQNVQQNQIFGISTGWSLRPHQIQYSYEIIAQKDTQLGDYTPQSLGQASSINDTGKVAFIIRGNSSQQGVVILKDGDWIERDYPIGQPATVSDYVQVNNADQVIFRQGYEDGLISHIQRLDSNDGGVTIGSGSYTPSYSAPFDIVLEGATLNNSGRGLFSADIGIYTVLATRTNGIDNHNVSPGLTGYPMLYPMLADNDTSVVQWGGDITSPIIHLIDANLNAADWIADSGDYNALGAMPGISDDGTVVAFVGDDKNRGLGIYVSIFDGLGYAPVKIVGVPNNGTIPDPVESYIDTNMNNQYDSGEEDLGRLNTFTLQARVCVNRVQSDSTTEYNVVYIGFSLSGKLGLYTSCVDISSGVLKVTEPSCIIEEGDTITGLEGQIDNIKIYDVVNNESQYAFWVSTTTGEQAIVRAKPELGKIDIIDPNPSLLKNGAIIQEANELADARNYVEGLAADGVTQLLIRLETDRSGFVSFRLEDNNGISSSNGTLSEIDGTESSYFVIVDTQVLPDGRNFAFALLTAPVDFVRILTDGDQNKAFRPLYLRATFFPDDASGEQHAVKQIELHRPPVMLIHGLWSNAKAWDWDFFVQDDSRFFVYAVDYERSHADPFIDNIPRVYVGIKRSLNLIKTQNNIAATQVDVVGHSMGGLLSRLYIADYKGQNNKKVSQYFRNDNFNKGDIHKLITLDTPHEGSILANALVSGNDVPKSLGKIFQSLIPDNCITCGAVSDLRTDSYVITNIPDANVYAHALVGTGGSDILTLAESIPGLTGKLVKVFNFFNRNFWLSPDHDLIVSKESQEGRLAAGNTTSYGLSLIPLEFAVHITVNVEKRYNDRVIELLNESVGSSDFAQEFPAAPTTPNPVMVQNQQTTELNDPIRGLEIIQPISGSEFTSGDTFQVEVDHLAGFSPEKVLVVSELDVVEDANLPFQLTLSIPDEFIGPTTLTAYGLDSNELLTDSQAIELTVLPDANLIELFTEPEKITLYDFAPIQQLRVYGIFDDGFTRELTEGRKGIMYEALDPNIVSIDSEGFITSRSAGNTYIEFSYQQLAEICEVIVESMPEPLFCGDFGSTYLEADFDQDCYVKMNDLGDFSGHWLFESGNSLYSEEMDFDGNGIIDLSDLLIFTDQWLQCTDPEYLECTINNI